MQFVNYEASNLEKLTRRTFDLLSAPWTAKSTVNTAKFLTNRERGNDVLRSTSSVMSNKNTFMSRCSTTWVVKWHNNLACKCMRIRQDNKRQNKAFHAFFQPTSHACSIYHLPTTLCKVEKFTGTGSLEFAFWHKECCWRDLWIRRFFSDYQAVLRCHVGHGDGGVA